MSATEPSAFAMPTAAELGFDPDALRARYREERDKRLRPEGNQQYVEVTGEFSRFVDDPYVEAMVDRVPLAAENEILVIGGGFGGLVAAARLREAGFEDIRILERGGDFGGTWYWNRYPGAQCDIESYIYLPLLEETGYIPREKYSFAPEILEHARRIGEHYGLYRLACFQTQVEEMRWDDAEQKWHVSTNRGDRLRARFVVMSNGPLNRPKLPGIPGIGTFAGHTFHTSRWDYDYTGGDATGNLHRLGDKRVGIIGTGATAIQCVPHLGRHAAQLYVFQRTPSSVDERRNAPTDADWARSLRPGWQQQRRENFAVIVAGGHQDEDLVSDGWTDIIRNLASIVPRMGGASALAPEQAAALTELADFRKMNQIRARVDSEVRDRETAEALKPWYRQFCKRPTFNDEYLPTFNRPNVKLVDTHGRGVERITERGVVVDGVEYEVDCLIFATGFEVGTAYTRRAGFEIYGRGGVSLTEYWTGGLKTLHGFYSRGFPNCFHMGITQNGLSVNFTSMLDEQAHHIAYVIAQTLARQAPSVEPSAEAEAAWVATIRRLRLSNTQFFQDCTPGYYNNEGRPGEGVGLADEQYGGGAVEFYRLMREWREAGTLEGLTLQGSG